MWPGFGENSRVLKWVFERAGGEGEAVETPIGHVPKSLDMTGLSISSETMSELFRVDKPAWRAEAAEMRTYLKMYGTRIPLGITAELDALEARLK